MVVAIATKLKTKNRLEVVDFKILAARESLSDSLGTFCLGVPRGGNQGERKKKLSAKGSSGKRQATGITGQHGTR